MSFADVGHVAHRHNVFSKNKYLTTYSSVFIAGPCGDLKSNCAPYGRFKRRS